MRPAGLALLFAAMLSGSQPLQFQITDARGKQTSAFTIEAGPADADGWHPLTIAFKGKPKGAEPVLIWPFDAEAKPPDGPEPIPAIAIRRGDPRALASQPAMAAVAAPVALGMATLDQVAMKTGFSPEALANAFASLSMSNDPFEKGIGLLYAGKAADAAAQLAIALRQRERQLTRAPSEIYPAAMLCGQALYRANKFDDAAVAFRKALGQRPSDAGARKWRSEALAKAGKPAAE